MTPPEAVPVPRGRRRPTAVAVATLRCESCGEPTPHRILSLKGADRAAKGRAFSGIGRCQKCRWTHPFESVATARRSLRAIVSEGPVSRRIELDLPPQREVGVGGRIRWGTDELVIQRIELPGQRSVARASVREVGCLWLTPDRPPHVPVSIIEGRRTRSIRWTPPEGAQVGVGDDLRLDGETYQVTGLRTGGRTLRRISGPIEVRSIDRLYVRRTWNPPAGRSDWRSSRETPSSRASSRSRSFRDRSSSGASRTRRPPAERSASGGAATHRGSPS
jgi:uncharacterized Zn finger protein